MRNFFGGFTQMKIFVLIKLSVVDILFRSRNFGYLKRAAKKNLAAVACNDWRLDFSDMKLETAEFIILRIYFFNSGEYGWLQKKKRKLSEKVLSDFIKFL
jgi:hypothetical protein